MRRTKALDSAKGVPYRPGKGSHVASSAAPAMLGTMSSHQRVEIDAGYAADGRAMASASGALYHGIPCRITAAAPRTTIETAWATLELVDEVFNVHRDDSELGRINAAGVGRHPVSPWLRDCLAIAATIEALSDGAWRATMLPLVRLWRAARRDGIEPDAGQVAAALAVLDDAWRLVGSEIELRADGAAFDLGGLAKGFAVDLVAEHLQDHGVDDFLVQVGGETACRGEAPGGGPHRIGIPHPDDPDGSYCSVLRDPGSGLCGSTSGDDRLGQHILDPRSGHPATAAAVAITCVFPGTGRNALADGLTTALSVMEPTELPRICAEQGCAALCLRRDPERGLVSGTTPGWRTFVAEG